MNKIHKFYLVLFAGFFAQITAQDINLTTQQEVIQKAFSYKLDTVVNRYKKEFNVSDQMAMQVEQELKRFLILCSLFPKKHINMYSSDVDDLWHTFVIFTRYYMKFCNTVAGNYIHHNPHSATQSKANTEPKQEFINLYTQIFSEAPPEHIWKGIYNNASQEHCSRGCEGSYCDGCKCSSDICDDDDDL